MTTLPKSQKDQISPLYPKFLLNNDNRKILIDWLSGLVGGFISVTVCAPLDLARTRHMLLATTSSYGTVQYKGFLHTAQTIVKDEGIRGLYKGYNVTAFSIPLFHSLYFSIFYKVKRLINEKYISKEHDILTNVVSSIFTGFVCDTITCPLWVIRTRIQTQYLHKESPVKYRGMIDGLYKMYKEEGIKSYYKGLFTSYIGLSHAAILYPLYEYLKKKLRETKGELSSLEIFFVSLFSKTVAMVMTYPHVVIRARQQDQRTPLQKELNIGLEDAKRLKNASMIELIQQALQKEGLKGLYSGLRIDLIRVLPSNAITFVMFEKTKKYLEETLPKNEPRGAI